MPFALCLDQLKQLRRKSVTASHKCYGSPLHPTTNEVYRVRNMTGIRAPLLHLLTLAWPLREAAYLWSNGLGRGTFGGIVADCYRKDLPIEKRLTQKSFSRMR
ncbi:hypothetical protein CGRA01v4_14911 [Colletotrichum graminicola]|uniref:Uncharacterized protein n=1 Tax=Colletotrichum graminicola (strain M1.001 / M2 / FGSC 10212) TaxID=645133 RepID=E3QFI8_COLGM|nr:uncharacterized protein GLRG_04770 [Colletotrichum graminicola M1.001]EFQ29626.1 hypothetical protein GLRG_04770 [Colletotrichum graminicola M1.001]WDK23619.1 hypothetical protein CGRA01v4_14911 [Colletotrichum graminicola]